MRNEHVIQVLAFLNESWANKPLGAATMAVWGSELGKHDYRAVLTVLQDLVRTQEWRPSLAQILKPLLADPDRKSASAAFETVWGQINKRPREVSELEAQAVQRLGGWPIIGNWQLDQRHWHAKQFAAVYDELTEDARGEELRALASGQRALGSGER